MCFSNHHSASATGVKDHAKTHSVRVIIRVMKGRDSLSIRVSDRLYVCLSVYTCVCLSIRLSVSVRLYVYLCLSACPCTCLFSRH
ncbi:hypothetical protein FKM82_022684 [Ascaphus truei]